MLSDRNDDTMIYLKAKLVKNNEKLENITEWFYDKDEKGGTIGETLTLGTEENQKALMYTSAIPIAPLALGVGAIAVGFLISFPLIGGPGVSSQEQMFLTSVQNAGEKVFNFAGGSLGAALRLAAVPLGVAVVSIPKKLFRMLTDKVEQKTDPIMTNNENIISLIDDLLAKKDDPTLKFPALFLRRVDIRNNSEKFNKELLGHLAYYRHCLQRFKNEEILLDDVREAYDSFVSFLKESKRSFAVSKNFRHNRFINLLIDGRLYNEEDYFAGRVR